LLFINKFQVIFIQCEICVFSQYVGNPTSVKNYALSSEEQNKLISEIQNALNDHNHVIDDDDKLQLVINTIMNHCFELLEMKTRSANVDSATCERNLWWIGGFRPSQLLQVMFVDIL